MKYRWWIVGAVAVLAGGILMVRHFSQEKRILHFTGNEVGKSIEESQPENFESDVEAAGYLV